MRSRRQSILSFVAMTCSFAFGFGGCGDDLTDSLPDDAASDGRSTDLAMGGNADLAIGGNIDLAIGGNVDLAIDGNADFSTGGKVDLAVGCAPLQTVCNNGCVNTMNDPSNCGACGRACNPGFACNGGACACPQGKTACNNACVNIMNDPANCGKCANACPMGMVCMAGGCAASCAMPLTACRGACVDLRSDPGNCNGCGIVCAYANAIPACVQSVCTLSSCSAGFGNCDNNAMNGCEANIQTDSRNCGGCGKVCGAVANGTPGCAGGICGVASCAVGYADCNKNSGDGCEVNTVADSVNCGACGKACAVGETCTGGACTVNCSAVAQAYCKAKGWVVSPWATAWPNQPGGAIYCLAPGIAVGSICETCNTYNEIVWKNGAKDACSSNAALAAGSIYAGHSPCQCLPNNLLLCGNWPMNGCFPD